MRLTRAIGIGRAGIETWRRHVMNSPAAALVPLRFFLGGTFLFAGLDKLVTPSFFVAGAPGSIQVQLAAFARHSPLGGLISMAEPWAIGIGWLIATAEIGIGLGVLSGFGFRLAAAGGAALSLVFWLTASWATHPYYYGPDLPYAMGWITLALAGSAELLVTRRAGPEPRRVLEPSVRLVARRTFIEAGVLGTLAVLVASLAVPLRGVLGANGGSKTGVGVPSPTPTPSETPPPTAEITPPPTVTPGIAVATIADVQRTGSAAFTIPFDAPRPLPAGDPAVIVRLPDGSFVAFDAICTHAGCTVEWVEAEGYLICPCHGAAFDPVHGGRVVEGPTDLPLVELPLMLDPASGRFLLRTG